MAREQQRSQIREGRSGRADADEAVRGDEDLLPAGSRRLAAHACVAFDAASPANRAGVFIQCFGGLIVASRRRSRTIQTAARQKAMTSSSASSTTLPIRQW